MNRRGRSMLVALGLLVPLSAGAGGPAFLVRDISPGPDASAVSDPSDFIVLGDVVLFTADDNVHGRELWRTDGTSEGTVLVKDINPGSVSSIVYAPDPFTPFKGAVFFVAYDQTHGGELWRTDGTADGTVLVKDINPGAGSSSYASGFFEWNGTLFFAASDETAGAELWKSDGTDNGTVRVADINPGMAGSSPYYFTPVGSTLFFVANDGTHGCELWRTDGTEAGTRFVKDTSPSAECEIGVGPYDMFRVYVSPTALTDVAGTLYFVGQTEYDQVLWKSDGTEAGTVPLRSFGRACHAFEQVSCPPGCLTDVGGGLYFNAEDYEKGRQLWRSDGTPDGTVMVKDINPHPCSFGEFNDQCSSDPCGFVQTDGAIYFTAHDANFQYSRWVTDGTTEGTQPAPLPTPTPGPTPYPILGPRVELNGSFIFAKGELYKTDGTDAGTVLLKDINLRPASSFPSQLTDFDGTLSFFATDIDGLGLWRSDGTAQGTTLVKIINAAESYASHRAPTVVGDRLMFVADDGVHGAELWSSDGTAAGTNLVKDIYPGIGGGFPLDYLAPTPELVALGRLVLFPANDGHGGTELWRSDGTTTGTFMVKDIYPGPDGSIPIDLTQTGGTLYFTALDGPLALRQLWQSDGTPEGTIKVTDPELVGRDVYGSAIVNGTAYWVLTDPPGWGLWRSDGTSSGSTLLRRFTGYPPTSLVNLEGILLFVAPTDDADELSLWRSDGSEAGTSVVKNIHLPPVQGGFLAQAVVNGTLFFTFYAEGVGDELWKSDGAADGTRLVKDINPGPGSSLPSSLVAAGGLLVFTADDGVHGRELWESDGTEDGTRLLQDIAPGDRESNVFGFMRAGSNLYFTADDGTSGYELWAVPLAVLSPCSGDCNADFRVTIDEVVKGVKIALGGAPIDACIAVDSNRDGSVTIAELVAAVNHALAGCG